MKPLTGTLPATLLTLCCLHATAAGETLKVYVLAGQSNMLGSGMLSPATTRGTLEHTVANDPDKA